MQNNANEGHPGYIITQIHNVMGPGLAFKPNVVLLHAGTNDLNRPPLVNESWADAPKRLTSLIDDVVKTFAGCAGYCCADYSGQECTDGGEYQGFQSGDSGGGCAAGQDETEGYICGSEWCWSG